MKKSKILTITAIAFAFSMNNFAMTKNVSNPVTKAPAKTTAPAPAKLMVAVVDVQKVVESSPAINSSKLDRKNKLEDLAKFVENAKSDVAKETNASKKKILEDGYNKELNVRKDAIDKEYVQKLSEVDRIITTLINTKTSNYDLVLVKTSVLKGGVDITSEIVKELK